MGDATSNWDNCLQHAVITDVGMRRSNNQDAFAVVLAGDEQGWETRGHLFMVADGMGAHAAGELASKLAVGGVPHHYHKYRDMSPPEALRKAFWETNAEIHRRGEANSDFHQMGTTASVMVLLPQGALVAHVGDSRIYRLQQNRLDQLTFDHSLVWELRAAGQLPKDERLAKAIPKNVITRSLGPNASVQVDVEGPFETAPGDTFLLCSDGLTGQVPDEEIGLILAHLPPREAARVLVDLANLRGGPDNITVVVVQVVGERAGTDEAREPLAVGTPEVTGAVSPLLWVMSGVGLVCAIGLALLERPRAALAMAAVGLISLAVAAAWKVMRRPASVLLAAGRRLGKGPYTSLLCAPNAEFVTHLAEVAAELREAAGGDAWTIEWQPFEQGCERAETAARKRRYDEALRSYARAISYLMQQLRSQRQNQPDTAK